VQALCNFELQQVIELSFDPADAAASRLEIFQIKAVSKVKVFPVQSLVSIFTSGTSHCTFGTGHLGSFSRVDFPF
jgi:hypothetical protein